MILLFLAYGIQLIEWPEEASLKILGLPISSTRKVKQQYRVMGIIPVSNIYTVESHCDIMPIESNERLSASLTNLALSVLPFGGLIRRAN